MRVYPVIMAGSAVTSARTLIQLRAPASAQLVILRGWISQQASETSEQLEIQFTRSDATTNGTGGTITPEKLEVSDPAAAGTYVVCFTAEPTTYNANPVWRDSFNVLTGLTYIPQPEERIWVPPSGRIGFRLINAPTASLTMTAGMMVGEVG